MKTTILGACLIIIIVLGFFLYGKFATSKSLNYAENYIPGIPYEYQIENNWCGPASLAMVLGYWGENISQENIARSVIRPNGLTMPVNLAEYAEGLGFDAYYGPMNIEELKENISHRFPIIVLQRFSLSYDAGHFRVVVGYNDNNIITDDPILGENYVISYDNFKELWKTGNYENAFVLVYPHRPSS